MTSRALRAMGSEWFVEADAALDGVAALLEAWEAALSRFRPQSSLSTLNRDRVVEDPVLAQVIGLAMEGWSRTEGAFDPRLGGPLAALGYDRDLAAVRAPVPRAAPLPRLRVEVDGARVRLDGEGDLDLGGIGKGWAVDRLYEVLRRGGARQVLVDGGGDIRGDVGAIGVPGGHAARLPGAVATSAAEGRAWTDASGARRWHLLDPATGAPVVGDLASATVCAPTAVEAEIWAKAVLVRPEWIARLPATAARLLVVDRRGDVWVTREWEEA